MKSKHRFMATLLALLFFPTGNVSGAGAGQPILGGFNSPTGMVYDQNGNLYVAEWGAGRIARIKDGKASIILDGLSSPAGLAMDESGNMYIAEYGDGNIYLWNGKSKPRVIASGFSAPTGVLWSKDGALLVANRNSGEVVEVTDDGKKRVISNGHKTPVGLAQTKDGSLFVSCYGGSVDVVTPDGHISSIKSGMDTPGVGIVPAGRDSVYVVDHSRGTIVRVHINGEINAIANGLSSPVGLITMPDGNLMVGCWGNNSLHIINNHKENL